MIELAVVFFYCYYLEELNQDRYDDVYVVDEMTVLRLVFVGMDFVVVDVHLIEVSCEMHW